MKTRSKSNNLVAILIAVILFAIGSLLYVIHEQRQSTEPEALGQAGLPDAVTIWQSTPPKSS